MKTITLIKCRERFVFKYEIGSEAKVVDAIIQTVNSRDTSFDWFDAVILTQQMGEKWVQMLKPNLPKKHA